MAASMQSDSLSRKERETWERIVGRRRLEWAQLEPSILEGIIRVPWSKLIVQPQFESSEEKFHWLLSRYFERSVHTKVSPSKRRAAFLVVKKLLEKAAAAWVSHQSEQEEDILLQLETTASNTPNRDGSNTTIAARQNGSTHFESSSARCAQTSQHDGTNHFGVEGDMDYKPAAKPQTSSAHASTSLSKLAAAAANSSKNLAAANVTLSPVSKPAPEATTSVQSSGPVNNNLQNSKSSIHIAAASSSTRNTTLLNVTSPLTTGVLQRSGGAEAASTTDPGTQARPLQLSGQGLPAISSTTVPTSQASPLLLPPVSIPAPTVDPFKGEQTIPTRTPRTDQAPQSSVPKPDKLSSSLSSLPVLRRKASYSIPNGSASVAIQTTMGSAQSSRLVAASKDSPTQQNGSRKLEQETGERTPPRPPPRSRVCTPDLALPENLPSVPREIFFPADNNKFYGGLTPRPLIRTVHTPQNMTPQEKKQIASRLATWYPYWKMEEILILQQTCQPDSCDLRKVSPVPVKRVVGCKFRLSPNQIAQINGWKMPRQHPYAQDETRLLIHMLPLQEPSRQPEKGKFKARADIHLWPKGTLLSINGLPMPIHQRRQQGHDKDYWSGLSHFFDASATMIPDFRQEITVDACCYEDKPYAICIAICKFQTPAKLYDEIMEKFMDTLTMKEALQIARKMTAQNMVVVDSDEEEEDQNQSFIFKLTCAISSTLMRTPVRAKRCSHFQCFDLQNFIDCNQRVTGTSWECPVCNNELISLYELVHCPLTKSIADQYAPQVTAQRDRVEFFSDGTWKLLEEKKKRYATKQRPDDKAESRSAKVPKVAEVIDLL